MKSSGLLPSIRADPPSSSTDAPSWRLPPWLISGQNVNLLEDHSRFIPQCSAPDLCRFWQSPNAKLIRVTSGVLSLAILTVLTLFKSSKFLWRLKVNSFTANVHKIKKESSMLPYPVQGWLSRQREDGKGCCC